MITYAMTPGNDNQVIWLIKITTDNNIYRFGTRSITLSSNIWDGAVILKDTPSEIDKSVNVTGGGSLGQIGNFSFGIARHTSNALTSAFFNEFFPQTSGEYLSGRLVTVGMVWAGATSEDDITWLEEHFVYGYLYTPKTIFVDCIESAELETFDLPYYTIQKDLDNGMSYYPNAPSENFGQALPLVYGDFSVYEDDFNLFKPHTFPIICVDQYQLKFICASHKFHTVNFVTDDEDAYPLSYQFANGFDTYMSVYSPGGGSFNGYSLAYILNYSSINSASNRQYGYIDIQLKIPGTDNTAESYINAVDDKNTTYETLALSAGSGYVAGDKIELKIDGSENSLGRTSFLTHSVEIRALITGGTTGATNTIWFGYWNDDWSSGVGGNSESPIGGTYVGGSETHVFDITNNFDARDKTDEPWTWQEISNLLYYIFIANTDPATDMEIRVTNFWLHVDNILVAGSRPYRNKIIFRNDRVRNGGGR